MMETSDRFSSILLAITLHVGQTLLTRRDVSGSLYVISHVLFQSLTKSCWHGNGYKPTIAEKPKNHQEPSWPIAVGNSHTCMTLLLGLRGMTIPLFDVYLRYNFWKQSLVSIQYIKIQSTCIPVVLEKQLMPLAGHTIHQVSLSYIILGIVAYAYVKPSLDHHDLKMPCNSSSDVKRALSKSWIQYPTLDWPEESLKLALWNHITKGIALDTYHHRNNRLSHLTMEPAWIDHSGSWGT